MRSVHPLTLTIILLSSCISISQAAITVLGQTPLGQVMATSTTKTVSGPLETYAAYDDLLLTPPPLPNPLPALGFVLELPDYGNNVLGLAATRKIRGSFFGFSVEMSVM
jgi:hypothetical protein